MVGSMVSKMAERKAAWMDVLKAGYLADHLVVRKDCYWVEWMAATKECYWAAS